MIQLCLLPVGLQSVPIANSRDTNMTATIGRAMSLIVSVLWRSCYRLSKFRYLYLASYCVGFVRVFVLNIA